jgi:hypothetical protein
LTNQVEGLVGIRQCGRVTDLQMKPRTVKASELDSLRYEVNAVEAGGIRAQTGEKAKHPTGAASYVQDVGVGELYATVVERSNDRSFLVVPVVDGAQVSFTPEVTPPRALPRYRIVSLVDRTNAVRVASDP